MIPDIWVISSPTPEIAVSFGVELNSNTSKTPSYQDAVNRTEIAGLPRIGPANQAPSDPYAQQGMFVRRRVAALLCVPDHLDRTLPTPLGNAPA